MKPAPSGCRSLAFGILLLTLVGPAAAQWTLEQSVQRALEVSPELSAGAARVDARRAAARQAGTWPNPTLELTADNGIARERGGGAHELSKVSLTQPLPLGLRASREAAAEALVTVESRQAEHARLELEHRVAEAFHSLQLAQIVLDQAREAARQAREFARTGERRAAAGDISRRETLRLALLSSEADQAIEEAEGKWQEALSHFASLLDLAPEDIDPLPALTPPPDLPPLEHWLAMAESHPGLARYQANLAALGAERQVARSERMPQIGVRVFGERELVDNSRESVTGVGVYLELPLWDRRQGRLAELAASTQEGHAQLRGERRRLVSLVRVQHQHLTHLMAQAEHQAGAVLAPAQEILTLSQRGYADGELELLALIEAVQTTRNAEARYHRLLTDAWLELAALRASAGQFLVATESESNL
jgi:outer membrane protein, heavy metal efflux system